MRLVWKTVEAPPRNWRSIAKALILVEHLIKNGAEKVVGDVQQHIHDISALTDFRYLEGNLDRGSGGGLVLFCTFCSRWTVQPKALFHADKGILKLVFFFCHFFLCVCSTIIDCFKSIIKK